MFSYDLLTLGMCSKYGAIQFITKNKQIDEMMQESWEATFKLVFIIPRPIADPAGPQPKKEPPILLNP